MRRDSLNRRRLRKLSRLRWMLNMPRKQHKRQLLQLKLWRLRLKNSKGMQIKLGKKQMMPIKRLIKLRVRKKEQLKRNLNLKKLRQEYQVKLQELKQEDHQKKLQEPQQQVLQKKSLGHQLVKSHQEKPQ
jgi:hypothetical protein